MGRDRLVTLECRKQKIKRSGEIGIGIEMSLLRFFSEPCLFPGGSLALEVSRIASLSRALR